MAVGFETLKIQPEPNALRTEQPALHIQNLPMSGAGYRTLP